MRLALARARFLRLALALALAFFLCLAPAFDLALFLCLGLTLDLALFLCLDFVLAPALAFFLCLASAFDLAFRFVFLTALVDGVVAVAAADATAEKASEVASKATTVIVHLRIKSGISCVPGSSEILEQSSDCLRTYQPGNPSEGAQSVD